MSKGLIILAAGGTGGHLFPAQALAETLVARGYSIHLMTDERVHDYGRNFPAAETHIITSASPSLAKPLMLPSRIFRLYSGYGKAKALMKNLKAQAVVGFGGYPSVPPLLAAHALGIPTMVHEQNAVLGRANRFLARRVDKVATSFRDVLGMPETAGAKVIYTGNPVRGLALAEQATPFPKLNAKGAFPLVVFGGSQGASFFSDFMPEVLALIPETQRQRLVLVQQCRASDLDRVRKIYASLGIKTELSSFFANMPRLLGAAALVMCRSGASTMAELGVIGRPAVLVPLPGAIDNDQLQNAKRFVSAGAGWLFPQGELKPADFAVFLSRLMDDREALKKAAAAALDQGVADAASRLADATIDLAKHKLSGSARNLTGDLGR